MTGLPDLLDRRGEVIELMRQGPAGLFTDIDGTLAPIVPDYAGAEIPEATRAALIALARRLSVVALTGRGVADAHRIVGLDEVVYSGNHGAEWLEDGVERVEPLAAPYVARMHEIAQRAERELALDGVFVEDKGPSVSIHYRNAADRPSARAAVLDFVASAAQGMRLGEGKMVVEVRPPVALSKGEALRAYSRRAGLAAVLAIGDDLTDAEAFGVVREMRAEGEARGSSVAVTSGEAPPKLLAAADYTLDGPLGVQRFLVWLAETL